MDFTEQYIKQCEKAWEIQEHRHAGLFKRYYAKGVRMVRGGYEFTNAEGEWFASQPILCKKTRELSVVIWLPSQSDLQEMVDENWVVALDKFGNWINDNCADEWSFDNKQGYGSMEQLWLALLYSEKYQKRWDSEKEEWVTSPKP